MKHKIFVVFGSLIIAIIIISIIYGLAYLGKFVSYKVWYEDQVQQTIIEMVDEKYLIKKEEK